MEAKKLIAKFADDLRTTGKTERTISGYIGVIRQFSKFMNGNLLNVTKKDLQAYLNTLREQDRKQITVKFHFTAMSEFYEFLIYDERYTLANPIPSFRKRYLKEYKATSGKRYCPSNEEVIQLVNSISNTRDLAIIAIMFQCGLRRKEIRELDINSVNLEKRTLLLTPTKKRSNLHIFFTDECARCLQRWIKRREAMNVTGQALFVTKLGKRMSPQSIDNMFRKYAKAAGFTSDRIEEKLTPHCCRHWFTTELIKRGMKTENVIFLRGDVGQSVATRSYYHPDLEEIKTDYLLYIPQLGLT